MLQRLRGRGGDLIIAPAHRREGVLRRDRSIALSFLLLLFFLTSADSAPALTHQSLGSFGSAAQPSFGQPSGMAVDPATGDLLVIDLSNSTVSRYDSEGSPNGFSALGTNVIDGSGGEDMTPQGRILSVEIPGEAIEAEVAVAPPTAAAGSAGNIYVTDAFDEVLDVFDSAGRYLTQLSAGYSCGVAVDAAGNVYVGDWYGSIRRYTPTAAASFDSTGNWEFAQTGVEHPCTLAAGARPLAAGGSEGFIFATNWLLGEQTVTKLSASTGEEQYVVDSAGNANGLAVDLGTGRLYVAGGAQVREYDVSGTASAADSSTIPLASEGRGAAVSSTAGSAGGQVYVSRSGDPNVEVWSSAQAQAPHVRDPEASAVGETEATLRAEVNPEGAMTSVQFEYVDQESFEIDGGFVSANTVTTPEIGTGFGDSQFHEITESIAGLTPGTHYRWRLVATNSCSGNCGSTAGPPASFTTFSTAQPDTGCSNEALRNSLSQRLFDCRAFEMVSPPQKNSGEIAVPTAGGGRLSGLNQSVVPLQASPSGGAISYPSGAAFADPASAPLASQYQSRREASGWTTANLGPRFENAQFRDPVVGLSPDLAHAALLVNEPKLAPDAQRGFANLYRRDADGLLFPLTTEDHRPEISPATSPYCLVYGGASDDFDHMFLAARGALIAGDPIAPNGTNLYEWHRQPSDAVQALTVSAATGDYSLTVKLSGSEETTAPIAAGATATQVMAALEALSLIGAGNVQVSGGPGDAAGSHPYFVSFRGDLGDLYVPELKVADISLSGGPAMASLVATEPGGHLRLVSVLPDGTAAQPDSRTGFGSTLTNSELFQCKVDEALMRHAVNSVGSRVFWTYVHGLFEISPGEDAANPLLARVDGEETVQLDARQGGEASHGGEGRFWDATPDGSKVFFTDSLRLTGGPAHSNDLYMYDFTKSDGTRLTNLTAQAGEAVDVLGVIGASQNGDYVYFVASGAVSGSGAGPTGDVAQPGEPNLYVWHDGSTSFIATLAGSDRNFVWSAQPNLLQARVTPDGKALAFVSSKSLTGYDNRISGGFTNCGTNPEGIPAGPPECREAFLYNAQQDDLICPSCNPTSVRPQGPPGKENETSFPVWSTPYEQARFLSDDGSSLFFQSVDRLVAGDGNGRQDVYEWEAAGTGTCIEGSPAFSDSDHGCLALLSSGESEDQAYLLDASGSGEDVFLSTRSQLYAGDQDERYDVYDARVRGGFPAPVAPPECAGAGTCHGAATAGPLAGPVGTTSPKPFASTPHHCRHGKHPVHRHGHYRCVKKRRRHHHRSDRSRSHHATRRVSR